MAEKRRKVTPTVFCAVLDGSKVLMICRQNTGWMDGNYELPAGHIQDQERFVDAAIRELKEESDLDVKPKDLKLIHIYQNHNYPTKPHYGHVFLVKKWSGVPKNMEPDKYTEIKFLELDNLPDNVTPYVKEALKNINGSDVTFSFWEPGSLQG